jgi:hypothetical protein
MIKIIENLEKYEPENEYSIFIKEYFSEIIKYGSKKFISNIDVEVKILEVNWTLIPITFWNSKKDICFTSSIYWMFDYLMLESKTIKWSFLKIFVKIFSFVVLVILRIIKIEKTIFVNNLMLSTNISPQLKENDFEEIKEFLLKNFKNYSIIFRSINEFDYEYIDFLKKLWFKEVIFRQIFLSYVDKVKDYEKIKEVKSDKRLFEKSNYKHVSKKELNDYEREEIKECYDNLYLKKYSILNPNLNLDFFKNIENVSAFSIEYLINEKNCINWAFAYYKINGQITAPVFWYKNENLYRQITHIYTKNALKIGKTLNWSSWVWEFKMNRGAEKTIEYFFVYFENLWIFKRFFWRIIFYFSKNVWEKYLKNNVF